MNWLRDGLVHRLLPGMVTTCLLLSLAAAPPSLAEQVLTVKLVVEVTVPLVPDCRPDTKCNRPPKLAWKQRALKQVLFPAGGELPKGVLLPVVTLPSCKLEKGVSYLVLFTQDAKGRWTPLPLELQAKGRGTSLDRGYAQLLEGLTEAAGWHEERMRAVGPDQLWQAERKALHADNPWLRALAQQFLRAHEAADVVDAEWGAPDSAARSAEEAKASLPSPTCD